MDCFFLEVGTYDKLFSLQLGILQAPMGSKVSLQYIVKCLCSKIAIFQNWAKRNVEPVAEEHLSNKKHMISVHVVTWTCVTSGWTYTTLILVEHGVKISESEACYHKRCSFNSFCLPYIWLIASSLSFSRTVSQHTWHLRQSTFLPITLLYVDRF